MLWRHIRGLVLLLGFRVISLDFGGERWRCKEGRKEGRVWICDFGYGILDTIGLMTFIWEGGKEKGDLEWNSILGWDYILGGIRILGGYFFFFSLLIMVMIDLYRYIDPWILMRAFRFFLGVHASGWVE